MIRRKHKIRKIQLFRIFKKIYVHRKKPFSFEGDTSRIVKWPRYNHFSDVHRCASFQFCMKHLIHWSRHYHLTQTEAHSTHPEDLWQQTRSMWLNNLSIDTQITVNNISGWLRHCYYETGVYSSLQFILYNNNFQTPIWSVLTTNVHNKRTTEWTNKPCVLWSWSQPLAS